MIQAVFIHETFSMQEFKQIQQVPSIGHKFDIFFRPPPTVKEVIWYPKSDLLRVMKVPNDRTIQVVVVLS